MIIDFRCRPPYKSYLSAIMYRDLPRSERMSQRIGMEQAPSVRKLDLELTIQEMDSAGISIGVVSGRKANPNVGIVDNADICELVAHYPKRFVGLAGIDPLEGDGALEELQRYVVDGPMKAAVVEPGVLTDPMYADDERIYPIYQFCQQQHIPVMLMIGSTVGPDITYTMPQQIDRVAQDFPQLQLIIAHGGWPWTTAFCQLAYKRPNIYLLPDMYLIRYPGWRDYIDAANYSLKDKILFGSAYPFVPMEAAVEHLKQSGLRPAVWQNFFYDNAARLLGLEGS